MKDAGKGYRRDPAIDLVKAACIAAICATHFSFTPQQRMHPVFPLLIDMAVPMLIIVMGYNYASSFRRGGVSTFSEAYRADRLVKRLIRLLVPYLYFMLVEIVLQRAVYHEFGLRTMLEVILPVGGFGAGSYFVPVAVQIVFAYPFVYFTVSRRRSFGLCMILLVNIVYEYCCVVYGMGETCYRLVCLRYLFLLGIGTYLALLPAGSTGTARGGPRVWTAALLVGGALLLIAVKRDWLSFRYINRTWAGTSFLAGFYLFPIAWLVLRRGRFPSFRPLELVGAASYHIFMVQMVYYVHFAERVCHLPFFERTAGGTALALLVSVAGCCAAGVLFYWLESGLTRRCFGGLSVPSETLRRAESWINGMEKYLE